MENRVVRITLLDGRMVRGYVRTVDTVRNLLVVEVAAADANTYNIASFIIVEPKQVK